MNDWHASLPKLRLTEQQFFSLPDYSASLPTGTTPGKRWRRLDGSFDHAFIASGGKPRWQIGEYDPLAPCDKEIERMKRNNETPPKNIKINWYRPLLICPALTAPLPEHWQVVLFNELECQELSHG
jgi:hypothetical protein